MLMDQNGKSSTAALGNWHEPLDDNPRDPFSIGIDDNTLGALLEFRSKVYVRLIFVMPEQNPDEILKFEYPGLPNVLFNYSN